MSNMQRYEEIEQMDKVKFEAEVEKFVRMCRDFFDDIDVVLKINNDHDLFEAIIIGTDGYGDEYEIPLVEYDGTLFIETYKDCIEADRESLIDFIWQKTRDMLEDARKTINIMIANSELEIKDPQMSLFDIS